MRNILRKKRNGFSIAAASLMTVLLSAGIAYAASSDAPATPAPTLKIGVLNLQAAIAATIDGKRETAALERSFGPRQDKLRDLSGEIAGLMHQLQMEPEENAQEKSDLLKTISSKQQDLEQRTDDLQSELFAAEKEVSDRLQKKMKSLLAAYAGAHGYALIMDVADPKNPVAWGESANASFSDVTQDVIAAYDAQPAK